VLGDTVQEGDESFWVVLSNPTHAVLDNSSALSMIRNDD
jgi:hypothetical protein